MRGTFNKISNIGNKHNIKVYAVGGSVRDILLHKKEFGIDIAVEGDGIKFARLLQKEIGGKLKIHEKFGTASLIGVSGSVFGMRNSKLLTIDIASCREEQYPESAKLPKIRTRYGVSLREDLKRRDFTINAMALDLKTNELIDPFKGEKDLSAGLIRILHKNSFIDDPTRIFRAIRFAGRLNFNLEPNTLFLAKKSIKEGLIKRLTPKRIRNEIILILKEPERERILELMHKFKLLKPLCLKLPPHNLFKNIDENYKLFSPQELWFVYCLGIIELHSPSVYLLFTRKERQKIERTNAILGLIQHLESAKKPSLVYNLLEGTSAEELLFVASVYPKLKPKILNFLNMYSKVKLRISGKDLMKLGVEKGPLYNKLLNITLYAKLDGKIHNKKEELEFVKSYCRGNS